MGGQYFTINSLDGLFLTIYSLGQILIGLCIGKYTCSSRKQYWNSLFSIHHFEKLYTENYCALLQCISIDCTLPYCRVKPQVKLAVAQTACICHHWLEAFTHNYLQTSKNSRWTSLTLKLDLKNTWTIKICIINSFKIFSFSAWRKTDRVYCVIYPSLRGNIEEFDFIIPLLRMI